MAQILVVDDEPDVRELFNIMLRMAGHKTETASNGREAVDKLRIAQPDLVLLDLMMPHMDGFQLLAHLRAEQPTLPLRVLVATARVLGEDDRRKLADWPVVGVLNKGELDIGQMVGLVSDALGRNPLQPPAERGNGHATAPPARLSEPIPAPRRDTLLTRPLNPATLPPEPAPEPAPEPTPDPTPDAAPGGLPIEQPDTRLDRFAALQSEAQPPERQPSTPRLADLRPRERRTPEERPGSGQPDRVTPPAERPADPTPAPPREDPGPHLVPPSYAMVTRPLTPREERESAPQTPPPPDDPAPRLTPPPYAMVTRRLTPREELPPLDEILSPAPTAPPEPEKPRRKGLLARLRDNWRS